MTIDHDETVRLYTEEKLSIRQIAVIQGCSFQAIHHALRKRGIEMRPRNVPATSPRYEGARIK